MQPITTTVTNGSYAAMLAARECQHIRDTVHITCSHDLAARNQEIYARTLKIKELEQGDPKVISDFCDKIINAEADVHILLDALFGIKTRLASHGYNQNNRNRIRDAFKQVLFHGRIDHAASTQLYEAIYTISRMK